LEALAHFLDGLVTQLNQNLDNKDNPKENARGFLKDFQLERLSLPVSLAQLEI
jgi:hypothetical protein